MPAPPPDPAPQLRAQLLASEQSALLAARSTIQSELLTRITIFLTLVSAALVSIALIGNATGYRGYAGLFREHLPRFPTPVPESAHVDH